MFRGVEWDPAEGQLGFAGQKRVRIFIIRRANESYCLNFCPESRTVEWKKKNNRGETLFSAIISKCGKRKTLFLVSSSTNYNRKNFLGDQKEAFEII